MDDIRRRTIENAKTQASSLALRIAQFLDEYGGEGEQLLTMSDMAWLASAHRTLDQFVKRELV